MDRRTLYASEVIREIDALQAQKNALMSIARLTETLFGGQAEFVVNMQVTPTNPQTLAVVVQPGQIYQVDEADMTAWSSLLGDPTEIIQQGFSVNPLTFTIAPPPLVNESKWYLLEAQFQQLDTNTAILQYFNPVTPAVPLSGPGGTGAAQNQDRLGAVLVQIKAGTPAPTGDETKPTVDSGFLPLAYVHINFGQVSLGPNDITDARITIPTIPQILSGGLSSFGITPGLGGNLDASKLGGHPPGDFVLTSNQNLTGLARLAGGDTIVGLDTFLAGVHSQHYEYDQLPADLVGLINGSTWFNSNDNHLKVQLGNSSFRILTEADNGTGGIINAALLNGMSASQIEAQVLATVIPQLSNTLNFTKSAAQNNTSSSSGSFIHTFSFTIRLAVVMTNGYTLPSGGGTVSALLGGTTANQATVNTSVPAGGSVTYTILAFG